MPRFGRWRQRFENDGEAGLLDRRLGKASGRRIGRRRGRRCTGRAILVLRPSTERLFPTLQDRLPKELALAGIATMEAANVFQCDVYIPAPNVRFAVKAEQEGTTLVAIAGVDLNEILCLQEDRQVRNLSTISCNRLKLQIPASPLRAPFVKAKVKVRQHHDGTHAIFHGPRCWGRHGAKGVIEDENKQAGPPESARRPANENLGAADPSKTLSKENKTRRSGHMMCYQNPHESPYLDGLIIA